MLYQLSYFRRGLLYYGCKDSVFRSLHQIFLLFLPVVDDHRVAGIRDTVTEQAYPFLTDTDLSLIVQVVRPATGYACGITAFFQLQGTGYVVSGITVGAGQIVADGQRNRVAQFRDVGQAGNKTGDTHLNGRVTGNAVALTGVVCPLSSVNRKRSRSRQMVV